jgi:hypothetical protein
MELRELAAGEEGQVKAAERLFDHAVDLGATRRFLQDEANHLLIAYVEGEPAGFVSGTELTHPDSRMPRRRTCMPRPTASAPRIRSCSSGATRDQAFAGSERA